MYVDLTNSAGQTVHITTTGMSLDALGNGTAFFGFVGVGHGTYTASLFATTSGGVPVSTSTKVQVTL